MTGEKEKIKIEIIEEIQSNFHVQEGLKKLQNRTRIKTEKMISRRQKMRHEKQHYTILITLID